MKFARSNNSGCAVAFLLLWVTGWSAGTLTFDGFAFWSLARQWQSRGYDQVPGLVTKSEMRVEHDSDGTSYQLDLEYSYEVNGIGFTNERRRYGFDLGGHREVARMTKEYAVGTPITVFFDPANPQESVLDRGLSAADFFLPLFLVPFNMVMIGALSMLVGAPLHRRIFKRPGTIRVWRRDEFRFAVVYKFLPIAVAAIAALGLSFISIFAVGFGQMLLPVGMLTASAWCVVIGGSLFAYFKTRPVVRFELDEFHQRLTLRYPRQGDSEPIDLASIQSIKSRGDTVMIQTDGAPISVSCGGEPAAQWLRDWLREQCLGGSEPS